MRKDLNKAVKILNNGGIIIFPTDTAFGIGCRIDDKKAIKRLFEIRRRSMNKAVPVLVDSIEMAKNYLEKISDETAELMRKYWPGGLTIICVCKKHLVFSLVRGGGDTLGIRMPNNKISLELIRKCEVPILGPSANFHREKTPYSLEELDPELIKLTDLVLPGDASGRSSPSTVIDCSHKPWKILRQGVVRVSNFELQT